MSFSFFSFLIFSGGFQLYYYYLCISRICNIRALSFSSRTHPYGQSNRRTDAKRTCSPETYTIGDKHAGHRISLSVSVFAFDISLDGLIVVMLHFLGGFCDMSIHAYSRFSFPTVPVVIVFAQKSVLT